MSLRWFFNLPPPPNLPRTRSLHDTFSERAVRPIKKQEAQRLLHPNTRHPPDKPQLTTNQNPPKKPHTHPATHPTHPQSPPTRANTSPSNATTRASASTTTQTPTTPQPPPRNRPNHPSNHKRPTSQRHTCKPNDNQLPRRTRPRTQPNPQPTPDAHTRRPHTHAYTNANANTHQNRSIRSHTRNRHRPKSQPPLLMSRNNASIAIRRRYHATRACGWFDTNSHGSRASSAQ